MSTKQIRWIVLSMAIGLLGLVGFQLYWVSTALHLQQEQFDYQVTDALQEVVRSLERQEAQYQARQQLHLQQQQQQLMAIGRKQDKVSLPSAGAPVSKTALAGQRMASRPSVHQRTQPQRGGTGAGTPGAIVVQSDVLHPKTQTLTLEQAQVVEAFFRQQEELMAVGDWQTQLAQQQRFERWINDIAANPLHQLNDTDGTTIAPDSGTRSAHKRRPKLRRSSGSAPVSAQARALSVQPDKSVKEEGITGVSSLTHAQQAQIIKGFLKGLLMADRPLADRVNRFTLDTLLQQALQERGITIPFDFAVRSHGQQSFLFASMLSSELAQHQRFENGGYKAALFPNNILETGNYVYLFFPDQRSFILNRMTATLAGSALLILIIMGCFYVAISTILRQKKMADIKNDFINNMTHEFKTPISTISLAVDMAREQLRAAQTVALAGAGPGVDLAPESVRNLPDRLGRYMGIIRDENQRLGSHVEKVLQMALLDKGEVKLKLTPVNVHDVVEKVLNSMSLSIEQRQGEVDLEFDATDEIVLADEVHLTNMLYNLLDNAIKYSPDRVDIRVRTANTALTDDKTGTPRPAVSVAVADRGLGLTREQQSRIFDTFYRVPTGNRHDVKGFGLGLSYVKKMAEEHHGQVTVSSTPGEGSEFVITIPLALNDER